MDEQKIKGEEESRVSFETGGVTLEATLGMPYSTLGVVVFAHADGSARESPSNRYVARALRRVGFATLLVEMMTPAEEALHVATGDVRVEIRVLADRLIGAKAWLASQPATRALSIGYCGTSVGSAAALVAASREPADVFAVVSIGGRPDLAREALERVQAPTLLVVSAADGDLLVQNEQALQQLRAPAELALISGVTHLLKDEALEQVARHASNWFRRHIAQAARMSAPSGV